MTDLYKDYWLDREGEKINDDGVYQQGFLLWCRKLKDLTVNQFKYGFEQVEYECTVARRNGKRAYPPNYAEFIGMCQRSGETQCHKLYRHENHLEDKTAQERAREAGKKALDEMKGLF